MTKRTSLEALGATWRQWRLSRRTRDELRSLSDHQLYDIGLARADIERVAGRG
jgi:uncharacterized protein YjiS (DUF1127 family)